MKAFFLDQSKSHYDRNILMEQNFKTGNFMKIFYTLIVDTMLIHHVIQMQYIFNIKCNGVSPLGLYVCLCDGLIWRLFYCILNILRNTYAKFEQPKMWQT